jgi:hypothetical protein
MFNTRLHNVTFATLAAVLYLINSSGCGKGDSGRVAVWGNVTWKGQPVPAGVIYFSPDTKKGNKGPQGFALIKEGHYDSRDAKSKGCVTGPLVAVVQGCIGEGRSGTFPYGRPLFASHELALDVPVDGGQLDLTIPDSAKPYNVAAGTDVE